MILNLFGGDLIENEKLSGIKPPLINAYILHDENSSIQNYLLYINFLVFITDSYTVICKVLMSRDLEIEVNHHKYSVFNLIFNQDIQAGFFSDLIWYQEFLRLGLGKPWLLAISIWREKIYFITTLYLSFPVILFAYYLIFHNILIFVKTSCKMQIYIIQIVIGK